MPRTSAPPPDPDPAAEQIAPDPLAEVESAALSSPSAKVRINRVDDRGTASYVADIDGQDFTAATLQRFGGGRFQIIVRDTATGHYLCSRRVSIAAAPRVQAAPPYGYGGDAPAPPFAFPGSPPPPPDLMTTALQRVLDRLERLERVQAQPPNALGGLTIADVLAMAERRNQGMTPQDFAAIAQVFKRDASPLAEQIEAMKALRAMGAEGDGAGAAPDPLGTLVAALLPKIIEALDKPATPPPPSAQRTLLTRTARPPLPAHVPKPAPRPGPVRLSLIPPDQKAQLVAVLRVYAAQPSREPTIIADAIAAQMTDAAWSALLTAPPGAMVDEIIEADPALGHHRPFIESVESSLRDAYADLAAEAEADAAEEERERREAERDDVPAHDVLADGAGVPLVHTGYTSPDQVTKPPRPDPPCSPVKRHGKKGEKTS